MKYVLSALIIGFFVVMLPSCEKADQKALRAIDKAKALKEDLEKKAREIEEAAKGVLPESAKKLLDAKKKEGEDQGKEGKDE